MARSPTAERWRDLEAFLDRHEPVLRTLQVGSSLVVVGLFAWSIARRES